MKLHHKIAPVLVLPTKIPTTLLRKKFLAKFLFLGKFGLEKSPISKSIIDRALKLHHNIAPVLVLPTKIPTTL